MQTPDSQQDKHEEDQPEVERISRQPIHAQEPNEPLDDIARLKEEITEDIADEKVPEPLSGASEETESEVPHADRIVEEDTRNQEPEKDSGSVDSDHITDGAEDDNKPDVVAAEEPGHVDLAHEATPEPYITTEQEQVSESIPDETSEQEPITQAEEGESHTEPPAPIAESTPEFLDTPTAVTEEQPTPDEPAVESTEGVPLPTEDTQVEGVVSEGVPAPAEEEHIDQIPVATSEPTDGTDDEKHFEEGQEQKHSQETSEDIEEGGEQEGTTVDHEEEERGHREEDLISDNLEGDAPHEQQAASVQGNEHEHDEL